MRSPTNSTNSKLVQHLYILTKFLKLVLFQVPFSLSEIGNDELQKKVSYLEEAYFALIVEAKRLFLENKALSIKPTEETYISSFEHPHPQPPTPEPTFLKEKRFSSIDYNPPLVGFMLLFSLILGSPKLSKRTSNPRKLPKLKRQVFQMSGNQN